MSEEEGRKLHVVFSMDCLPAGGRGEVCGPERWDEAERSIAAFAEGLAEEGFGATLFVAAEAAARLRDVVEGLGDVSLGLLCHPQLAGYPGYLGSYGFERQREIVRVARQTWENDLGRPAESFRSGFFSGNDHTFHVLCMEGFRQSSCSLPGRVDNDQCSMWFGSYPFPHHTDPLDRSAQGTMEVFEVPVTSDFEAASYLSFETYTPPHLRIEQPDVHEYAGDLVRRQLDRMDEEDALPFTLHLVTSDAVSWGGDEDPHTERLRNLCAMLREVSEERGLELQPADLTGLHEACDERWVALRVLESDG
jgi:hypothetical protein